MRLERGPKIRSKCVHNCASLLHSALPSKKFRAALLEVPTVTKIWSWAAFFIAVYFCLFVSSIICPLFHCLFIFLFHLSIFSFSLFLWLSLYFSFSLILSICISLYATLYSPFLLASLNSLLFPTTLPYYSSLCYTAHCSAGVSGQPSGSNCSLSDRGYATSNSTSLRNIFQQEFIFLSLHSSSLAHQRYCIRRCTNRRTRFRSEADVEERDEKSPQRFTMMTVFCRTPHVAGKSLTALLQKESVSAGKWHCMRSKRQHTSTNCRSNHCPLFLACVVCTTSRLPEIRSPPTANASWPFLNYHSVSTHFDW